MVAACKTDGDGKHGRDEPRPTADPPAGGAPGHRALPVSAWQSDEWYRWLIDTASEAMFTIDPQGTFLFVNQATARRLNSRPEDLIGRSVPRFLAPEAGAEMEDEIRKAFETGVGQAVVREIRLPSGSRWYRSSVYPAVDESGTVQAITVVGADITEIKRAQQLVEFQRDVAVSLGAARDMAMAQQSLLEAILRLDGIDSGGVYAVEPATGAVHMTIHRGISPSFAAMVGHYPADTMQAQAIVAGQPTYFSRAFLEGSAPAEILAEGPRCLAVVPITHEGRGIAALNISSHTLDDVPEDIRLALEAVAAHVGGALARIAAQDALHRSRLQLEALFNTIDDLVFVVGDNGNILTVNPAVVERLGFSREELVGQHALNVYAPEDHEEVRRIGLTALEGETGFVSIPLRAKNGTMIPAETRVNRMFWDGQLAVCSISRDITERQRLQTELVEAKKMEAVGRLAGGVAHDFNNLLTAINGYAELMLLDASSSDGQASMAGEILDAGRRAAELVGSLLAFSRKQMAVPVVLDIPAFLRSHAHDLKTVLGDGIELDVQCARDTWTITMDPHQLHVLLVNLAEHAADAMSGKGRLSIRAGNVSSAQGTLPELLNAGEYVQLSVHDTGPGLDAASREHIFEPFYFFSHRVADGVGLRLAAAYGIVKQNGGHIWVDSALGEGTTFRIFLPRTMGKSQE